MIVLRTLNYSEQSEKDDDEVYVIPKEVLRHGRGFGRAILFGNFPGGIARVIVGDEIAEKMSKGNEDYEKIKGDAIKKAALISGLGNAAIGSWYGKQGGRSVRSTIIGSLIGGASGALGGALGASKAASGSRELADIAKSEMREVYQRQRNK